MSRIFPSLILMLLLTSLGGCGPQQPHGYTGYLYFAQGNYLSRFSLRDGSLSVAANLGDLAIREITPFGEDRLFLAGTASIGSRTVPRISWINLDTGEIVSQYSGILARYMANAGVVVYDDGIKLYAMPQRADGGGDEVIISHGLNRLTTAVEVSHDRLLFETGEPGNRVIRAWDAVTGEQQELEGLTDSCELVGAVWLEHLQQLVCRRRGSDIEISDYVLADLDGQVTSRLPLPEEGRFAALTYIADQGALVFKQSRPSIIGDQERSAVWIHDVGTGANTRLAKNKNLGGSVVYSRL